MTTPVNFSIEPLSNNAHLGVITLCSPKTLNALSLEMIDPITVQLLAWQNDPTIAAVWLQGDGEKAFCAGGDIVKLYESMVANPNGPNTFAEDFFSREYRLDYLLHTYNKPIICWGSGIVMGGGLGLLSGCSHRIVTETTRMAMPEITIGLFPDVGGTWFLNRMPGSSGMFLGLTGAAINAADAIYTRLADVFVPAAQKDAALEALRQTHFSDDPQQHHSAISHALAALSEKYAGQQPDAQVKPHMDVINQLIQKDNLAATVAAITQYQTDDKWLSRGVRSLQNGCAVTAHLVYEQLHRGKHLALDDVFRMELNLAMNCCTRGDFQEGVRALLIDKDQQPRWKFNGVDAVPKEWVEAHFTFNWTAGPHPLAGLTIQTNGKEQ